MKWACLCLVVLPLFIQQINGDFCLNDMSSYCTDSGADIEPLSCNANFSAAHQVMPDLYQYVHQHLAHNFQYLLMSTNFANYEKNREGLSKLYKKLSDSAWEDSIDLIKYITKRGSAMDFKGPKWEETNRGFKGGFAMYELESLSRALDMTKSLAHTAHKIHSEVTKRRIDYHDAETISYLESKFTDKHAERVRALAGHTNDLKNLIDGAKDPSLSIFMFDEYLKNLY